MWRPILRQMLCYYCEQNEVSKTHVLNLLLHSTSDEHGNENKKDLICEILGLSEDEKMDSQTVELPIVEQIQPKENLFSFI